MLAMGFDFAIEDSLEMATQLAGDAGVVVALIDRPWNRAVQDLPAETADRIVRCHDWLDVERALGCA
jgi:uncharacterized HAD superfamily protein